MEEQQQAQRDDHHRQFVRSVNSAAVHAVAFNANHFLQLLEQARIRITATHKGDLVVTNAGKLTAEQRAILASQKGAILQALGTVETF